MDNKAITIQAKKIMDSFITALNDSKHSDVDFKIHREQSIREDEKLNTNADFSDRMLKNAPETKNNCILAEKKKW